MPQRPVYQPGFEERTDEFGRRRLHFSVPRPMARLNLGMPWYERLRGRTFDDSTNRFGYQGFSLQSDYYLFGYVEKDTLIHTEKTTQLQTEKKWLQYSGDSQWLASKKNSTIAAEHKLTLVAGAGQGPIKPPIFGMDVRTDPYNNLNLHYCVDSVMNGVGEFFLGRKTRSVQNLAHRFDSSAATLPGDRGFYQVLNDARGILGSGLPDFQALYQKIFPGRPDEESRSHETLRYGYGKNYFTDFDPYARKKPDGVNPLPLIMNELKQAERQLDVFMKLGDITDNLPMYSEASRGLEFVGNLGEMFESFESGVKRWDTEPGSPDSEGISAPSTVWEELEETRRAQGQRYAATPSASNRAAELRIRRPPEGWGDFSSDSTVVVRTESNGPNRSSGTDPFGLGGSRYTVSIDPATGDLVFVSNSRADGTDDASYIEVGGSRIDELLNDGSPDRAPLPFIARVPREDVNQQNFDVYVTGWLGYIGSLKPDGASQLAPIVDAVRQFNEAFTKLAKLAEELVEFIGGTHAGAGPTRSAVGVFAKDGISLGTTDRMVSAAGKGYLFIADGGTGDADIQRYIMPTEFIINARPDDSEGLWDLGGAAEKETDTTGDGFTVFSNSTTSLVTRTALDLLAVGNTKNGDEITPQGIARLAATKRVEVTGGKSVQIAAGRHEVESDDNQEKATVEGGDLSLHGEVIRIGAIGPGNGGATTEVTTIPWPDKEADNKRDLEAQIQVLQPKTSRVEIRGETEIQIAMGPTGSDRELARRRRMEVQEEFDHQQRRIVELKSRNKIDQDAVKLHTQRRDAARAFAPLADQLDSPSSGLARGLDDPSDVGFIAILEMKPDEIRLGFRKNTSGAPEWAAHLCIRPEEIQLRPPNSAVGSAVRISVTEMRALMQGATEEAFVKCGVGVQAPGIETR